MAYEIESHIQMQAEENERAGMGPQEARRRAILKLGGAEQVRQAYRERDTLPWVENLCTIYVTPCASCAKLRDSRSLPCLRWRWESVA